MGGASCKFLSEPWREVQWGDREKDELLTYLKGFKPDGASHLRILLYGPVGVGKSSFINSVASVLMERKANFAATECSQTATESFTRMYKTYRMKFADGEIIPVVFNDIMGLEPGQNVGVRPEDIKLVMKGHVKDGYEFNPKKTMSPGHEKYKAKPTIEDKVHVLVCLLNANVTDISDGVLDKMREIKETARDLGIPQLAIATHIDQCCEEIEKDVQNVYKSVDLKRKMEIFSSKVGIPLNYIFPVWNNCEGRNKEDAELLLLDALKHLVCFGGDFLFNL